MSKEQILVVEDDQETATYLKNYFDWQGYEVMVANRGEDALSSCRLHLPDAVILDVLLPDLNGYEICRILRAHNRTSRIPIIFLTRRGKRDDIITAFEVGADDYVIKPFDVEELGLRVEGAIRRSQRGGVPLYPITGLPAGEVIMEQLRAIKKSTEPWAILYFSINNFDIFKAVGDIEGVNKVVVYLADLLREVIGELGTPDDFLGQVTDDGFVVITIPEAATDISEAVIEQFQANTPMIAQAIGLIQLAVKTVTSYDGPFADIREITQTLAKQQEVFRIDSVQKFIPQAKDLDYYRQLAEQVSLWQTAPVLAQALIAVDNLVATKIPDMHRLNTLLDLADKKHVSPETLGYLRSRLFLSHLASENLRQLPYRIRPYRDFGPVSLLETLEETVEILSPSRLTFRFDIDNAPDLTVALPKLKLQQAVYNLARWLTYGQETHPLVVSMKVADNIASLVFRSGDGPDGRIDPSTLLVGTLGQIEPRTVYGYLVQKIVSRFGGSVEANENRLLLNLPLTEPEKSDLTPDEVNAFWQTIREQRLFLTRQKEPISSPEVVNQASMLVDPLAKDLLIQIEALIAALNTSKEVDTQIYPWSAVQRYCQLYRLLALDLHRDRPLIPAPVNLKSLLESIKPLLAHRIGNHEIIIESDVPRPVINSDQARLSQVFVNLGLNALEAMPQGGRLTFHIKMDDYYLVEVIDTGTGIMPESLPFVFDPHFTTKGTGRGEGLQNVKSYVEQLHGQIEVSSELGQGTTVTVKLPPTWGAGYF